MTPEVDICVVGGGPAGAAAAASLARLGYHVTVLARRPRAPLGESLSPGAWPVLDALGIDRGAVRSAGVRVAVGGVRWTTTREERIPVEDGLTVDRARFDALLLEHARSAGAIVLPARAHRPTRTLGGWRVPHDEGAIEAHYLVEPPGGSGCSADGGSGPPPVRSPCTPAGPAAGRPTNRRPGSPHWPKVGSGRPFSPAVTCG